MAFSPDGKRMFVSVGSKSNVDDNDGRGPTRRHPRIRPEGKNEKIYASGIRNPVGLAIQPGTGVIWTSVNERDGLGDHLVPDYITHVQEGGFYGWPWYYIGDHQDPRHEGKHPELKDKVIVPDVILQSHSASLDLAFYTGDQFPAEFKGDLFASEHGSWNRARRTGYKVVRVPLKDGKATGEYEDFLVGFVTPEGNVWGRPVGVTVAKDGALLVTDDGSNTIWRVSFEGQEGGRPDEPSPGVHADRAFGGDRDHRGPDRAAVARRPGRPRGGPAVAVRQQPQADRPGAPELPRLQSAASRSGSSSPTGAVPANSSPSSIGGRPWPRWRRSWSRRTCPTP